MDLRERVTVGEACKRLRVAGWKIELVFDRIQLSNRRPRMVHAIVIGDDYMVDRKTVDTWVRAYSEW